MANFFPNGKTCTEYIYAIATNSFTNRRHFGLCSSKTWLLFASTSRKLSKPKSHSQHLSPALTSSLSSVS